jgi:hypothetical protein
MKSLRPLLFVFTSLWIVAVFTGCSKEKQLERLLYKGEGTWQVSNANWQKVEQNNSGQTFKTGSTSNAGSFAFDKDGSGSYEFTIDGETYSNDFTWTVDNETVSLSYLNQNVNFSGDITQVTVAFTGTETGKQEIEMDGSYTQQITSGSTFNQSVLSGTFSLKKD